MNRIDESLEIHSELNPKLFDKDKHLKPDVFKALADIADTFIEDLQENEVPIRIVDIWLVGSNASYNYTNNSDIDIHIIADIDSESCDSRVLSLLYNYAKSSFNSNHDITVKGSPVEVYIEDMNSSSISNGIYSLVQDKWLKEPKPLPFIDTNTERLAELKQLIDKYNSIDKSDIEAVNDLIDYAYLVRKVGLQDGEFSDGNLSFKEFRNQGYLDKLKELKNELVSKKLTLEKFN